MRKKNDESRITVWLHPTRRYKRSRIKNCDWLTAEMSRINRGEHRCEIRTNETGNRALFYVDGYFKAMTGDSKEEFGPSIWIDLKNIN